MFCFICLSLGVLQWIECFFFVFRFATFVFQYHHQQVVKLPLLPSNVTTTYNLACLHESCGEFAAAAELYRAILAKFPGYKDATLRLACVHQVFYELMTKKKRERRDMRIGYAHNGLFPFHFHVSCISSLPLSPLSNQMF